MCVGFWSLGHLDYALILCTNRDEFLSRPTENASFRPAGPPLPVGTEQQCNDVLSGLDLQAGGTWFGINRSTGHIALLTNITEPFVKRAHSRGYLVSSYLQNPVAPSKFVDGLRARGELDFGGFNLVVFSPSSPDPMRYDAHLITNHGGGGAITYRALNDQPPQASQSCQCAGISNGVDAPGETEWPKVLRGRSVLANLLESPSDSEPELTNRLFGLLMDQEAVPSNRTELRNCIQIPPMRLNPKGADASASSDYYGTRLSTILLVGRDSRVSFVERDIWQLDEGGSLSPGDPRNDRHFRFTLSLAQKGAEEVEGPAL